MRLRDKTYPWDDTLVPLMPLAPNVRSSDIPCRQATVVMPQAEAISSRTNALTHLTLRPHSLEGLNFVLSATQSIGRAHQPWRRQEHAREPVMEGVWESKEM